MDNIWKKNAKLLLIIVLDIFIISGATYAATTMYASNIVSYDNTNSGLDSDNVQGALDRLYVSANNYVAYETRLAALENSMLNIDDIYPVGSIYTSVQSTSPSTLFGGTWEAFGTGKTLVGADTSDTSFDTVEETGGAKTKSYTPAGTVGDTTLTSNQIPSHTHDYVKATGVGDHTLTTSEIPSHSHTIQAHAGSDDFNFTGNFEVSGGHVAAADTRSPLVNGNTTATGGGGAHNHPLSTSTVASGATGGGGSHTHSFTGTAASINVVQPYITVYMWKRTA